MKETILRYINDKKKVRGLTLYLAYTGLIYGGCFLSVAFNTHPVVGYFLGVIICLVCVLLSMVAGFYESG